jgi:hypothetical protein
VEQLNRKIVDEVASLCKAHGADLMLLYLPHGKELTDPEFRRPGERFLERLSGEYGTHHLNPRSLFLASDADFSSGHYRRPGAALVAHAVHEQISGLYPKESRTVDRNVRFEEPSGPY